MTGPTAVVTSRLERCPLSREASLTASRHVWRTPHTCAHVAPKPSSEPAFLASLIPRAQRQQNVSDFRSPAEPEPTDQTRRKAAESTSRLLLAP